MVYGCTILEHVRKRAGRVKIDYSGVEESPFYYKWQRPPEVKIPKERFVCVMKICCVFLLNIMVYLTLRFSTLITI